MFMTNHHRRFNAYFIPMALIAVLSVMHPSGAEAREGQGQVKVEIKGLRSTQGSLALALYPERMAKSFPKGKEGVRTFYLKPISEASAVAVFTGLEPGHYALSAMHDENSDGEMSFSFLGIPKEGFGFSNNPRIFFGPPSFEKAKFKVGEEPVQIVLDMKYF